MNKALSSVLLFFFLFTKSITAQINNEKTINRSIDKYLEHLKERHGIPGISVAVIKNDQLLYKHTLGNANIEHNVPLTDESIFRVYSLTKLMVATGVFKLVELGKISLDDRISSYVSQLPETWKEIQIKHLLAHSSGLPDMSPFIEFENLSEEQAKQRVFEKPLRFEAGSKYEYNQTSFWLLKKLIEKVTNQGFENYIVQQQFDTKINNKQVFFSSDSREIVSNRVTPYFPFRTGEMIIDHSFSDDYIVAANGLNITLNKFIQWDRAFNANRFVSASTKEKMWSMFNYTNDNKRFTYGWDEHEVNNEISFGFSGSLVTAYRNFPNKNMSIIFLSNGLEYYYNIENIVNHIAGLVDNDLMDVNNEVFEHLLQSAFYKGMVGVEKECVKIENNEAYKNVNLEHQINYVGYMLINLQKLEKAVGVFKLNTKKFPNSWNTYDSLGEGFERTGDIKNAINNYKKAISLNKLNENENNTRLKERILALSNGN